MRFLYLSISAAHACSLPSRHARTRRSSLHATWGPRVSAGGRLVPVVLSRRATGPLLAPEQFLDVPERLVIENCRSKVTQRLVSADQDIGTDQGDDRQVLHNQLLDPVIEALTLGGVERGDLSPHQRVDFSLPCGGGA